MNIFETAARRKFRYPASIGELTTEQLWDLPLTAGPRTANLDAVARTINTELKSVTEESFVNVKPDPRKGELEAKLEVVKHIIAVKVKANVDAQNTAARAEKRRKLVEALAAQEDRALASMSKDDILKQLAALDEA